MGRDEEEEGGKSVSCVIVISLLVLVSPTVMLVSDKVKVRPPTRYDRPKGEKIRTKAKEVRERDKERGGWIQPFFVPHLPFYFILSCF
jgi:hypothetical protein